ncbi:hypothetical protein MMC10_007928 [Thelotrema lepadinum]|nr:hypothetical protein [Thelotrema lepadinum]
MALVGNMISMSLGGNPSIVNYDMFVAVFSMLTLFYQVAQTHSDSFQVHSILPVAFDGLNTLFFLVGGIAMAGYLKVGSCSNSDYTDNNIVTSGSSNNFKRCQEAQATTAFLWFGFAVYAVSLLFSATGAGGSSVNLRGGIGGIRRGGAPSMSQV